MGVQGNLRSVVLGVLAAVVLAAPAHARPPMERTQLAYWPERLASTSEWARWMYGTDTFEPHLIVEHWTASERKAGALDYWNSAPDATWVHFIIDRRGQITQLAPTDVLAKHAFGVSPWAIGVEHVGTDDASVMSNRRMRTASYRLTCWLRRRLDIPRKGVIGHGEVLANPRFTITPEAEYQLAAEGYEWHTDMSPATMRRYRAHLDC